MIIFLHWSAGAALAMLNNQVWGKLPENFADFLSDDLDTKPQKQSDSSAKCTLEGFQWKFLKILMIKTIVLKKEMSNN